MCTIEGNTGTIVANGTTPHTGITGCFHLCQTFEGHCSGQPALSNRHYRESSTVAQNRRKSPRDVFVDSGFHFIFSCFLEGGGVKGWWLLAWGEIEMDPPGVGLFILRKTKRDLFSGI